MSTSVLRSALEQVIGKERADRLFEVLNVPQPLLNESGGRISRAAIAQALNMVLFEDLLNRVPDAKKYADDRLHQGTRIKPAHITPAGHHVVLGSDEVLGARRPGERKVDRALFASAHPAARLRLSRARAERLPRRKRRRT